MKIERFNERLEYTKNVEKQIIHYNWDGEGKIKYHVAEPDDIEPQNLTTFSTLEKAIEYLESLNWDADYKSYCIFKSQVRAITQEEINIILAQKNYNL